MKQNIQELSGDIQRCNIGILECQKLKKERMNQKRSLKSNYGFAEINHLQQAPVLVC